ncbi:TPA: hypothetical protein L4742_006863, partial [Pseudomonas aeruginosa]|nr:hypothetical protein [Pseudomonas aeruginosa]
IDRNTVPWKLAAELDDFSEVDAAFFADHRLDDLLRSLNPIGYPIWHFVFLFPYQGKWSERRALPRMRQVWLR